MPGYMPPAGNAVTLNFSKTYTPPLGNAATLNFQNINAYALTVGAGSYAVTGDTLPLEVSRLLRAYDNWITNGEFPIDTSGWSVSGADTTFAAVAGEGVLTLGPAAAGGFAWQAITVVPGRQYTLSALLKSVSTYTWAVGSGSYAMAGTDVTLTQGDAAAISNQSLSISHSGSVGVGYTLQHDGSAVKSDNINGITLLETWLPAGGSAASYDARATVLSGVTGSGTYGSWVNLSSDRDWGILESSVGTISSSILVELAHAGTGAALTSATIILTATRTS